MELYLLTFNLVFGTSLIILYLVGLVVWKYYDKKQRSFRTDLSNRLNSIRKGETKFTVSPPSASLESKPPLVIFPLSRDEMYPFEKQETIQSQQHTPSSHRIRASSVDYYHLHESIHSSKSLHYDHSKVLRMLWSLYALIPPLPFVSVLIQYMSDPVVFVERCSKIYGPCFSIYVWFGFKWTFMVGPDSNRIFFSDGEGTHSNMFNPMIDYSKASNLLNKAFENTSPPPRKQRICLPFISRRVRWQSSQKLELETPPPVLSKKQSTSEKEHLKQMLHEGFSSIQPLSEFVLENIRKEVKSTLFHLNHINLDYVDKNEMPAIAETDVETPAQVFGVAEDIFSEGLKKQKISDQVLVMGDVFSTISRFVIKSTLRSIFGTTFAKSHGDELSEIVSTLQVSCCDPLMVAYYNFFRFKLVESVWIPSKVYEIELKKQRLYELMFREIERHVKIYQFNQSNASGSGSAGSKRNSCLKTSNVASAAFASGGADQRNAPPKTYGCYMDYVLDSLGSNLTKYSSTIENTMSLYAVHFQELLLSVHKHQVTNLSWTICHLARDQTLQEQVRKEIYQFKGELQNQVATLVSEKTKIDDYLSKFDHLNGVMNDNDFDEPREELLEGIHILKREDLDQLNSTTSTSATSTADESNTTSIGSAVTASGTISDPFASHTSLDTIPSESIGTLSSGPPSPSDDVKQNPFVVSSGGGAGDSNEQTETPTESISTEQDQDTINFTEEQIITGELFPPHYLKRSNNRTESPSTPPPPKSEQLVLPNMERLSLAARSPTQAKSSKFIDEIGANVDIISPDLIHKGLVQKKLLFNALFVESVLSSSFDRQFESMHHSGLIDWEEISLRLLDACFKETTRLYSLKFFSGKTISNGDRNLQYFNYNIGSDQFISIIPYFSHHSKEYFPFETHTYKPERFLEFYRIDDEGLPQPIQTNLSRTATASADEKKQSKHSSGPSEVSELSIDSLKQTNVVEEDRTLMNKLRVDQAFTQYGYVPCKSHQTITKKNETMESNTSVLLDTCLGCNFINLSSRVFIMELLTHYKMEITQWQSADVSSNRYFSSESHDCAFPILPVALILNPIP